MPRPVNTLVAVIPSEANPATAFSPTVMPVVASATFEKESANWLLFNAVSPTSFETPDNFRILLASSMLVIPLIISFIVSACVATSKDLSIPLIAFIISKNFPISLSDVICYNTINILIISCIIFGGELWH